MVLETQDQGPEPSEHDAELLRRLVEHLERAVELMRLSNFVMPPDGDPKV